MHFFIDENISPNLANALNHLSQILDERHTVVHAREFNGGYGVPDQVWLEKLKKNPNWIIVSKDRFKKGDPERYAFENAGITIFNLGKEWNNKKGWETALRLITWWPTISREVTNINTPMMYELPWPVSRKLKGRQLPKPK
ncbi:MAG: hypothetical protein ACQEXI_00275 [Pseudomonadota bacterium]